MARRERSVHAPAFTEAQDFDAQLYTALRRAPWWMISIAAHVALFVLSSLLAGPAVATGRAPATEIAVTSPADPLEPEKPDDPEVDSVLPTDLVDPVPQPVDPVVLADKPEMDNDVPLDDVAGDVDGPSSGDFTGVSNNRLIGIGGGLAFGGRGKGGSHDRGPRGGGGRGAQDAVEDALRWLAAHQSPDGAWEAEGFGRWCDGRRVDQGPDGVGKAQYDPGVTGLAVLAFLGAGYTHQGTHPFATVVGRGIRWLRNAQDAEGCVGPRASQHYVYNHAVAALALVEAYGMTGSPLVRGPAQKALDFIGLARNPYYAWRYGVKPGDNDTSVTGWMMMALKSARLVNEADAARGRKPSFEIDADAFDGIRAWVEKMTDPATGRVGYQERGSGPARTPENVDRFPAEKSESMTAVGMLARVFLGENPKQSRALLDGAKLCEAALPRWDLGDGSIDMYYWYYATLAMFQVGGESWKKWDASMKSAIVDSQRRDGDFCGYRGSWDPVDPWGGDGGRVYATATMAMCLEVYYRYERVFGAR